MTHTNTTGTAVTCTAYYTDGPHSSEECGLPADHWPSPHSWVADADVAVTQQLDPIGYDDAFLIRTALLRLADHAAVQFAGMTDDGDQSYRERCQRTLVRARWLAGRSWNGATLSPNTETNNRTLAMHQLAAIAAEVSS